MVGRDAPPFPACPVPPARPVRVTAPAVTRASRPLRGAALLAGALLLFACLDATVKHLTAEYPVPLVASVRYAVQLLLMTALLAPSRGRSMLVTQRPWLVAARSLTLVLLTLLMNSALQRLPLAEATALSFAAPLLVVLLAQPLLREQVGWLRGAGVLAGFVGVLLIARPGGNLDPLGVTLALLAAGSNAAYQLLSRLLSGTERPVNLLYSSALIGTLCFGLMLPWFLSGPPLTPLRAALFLSLGVTGGGGHLLFTLAFREAPASFLAPISYLQLVWAALLGLLIFGHVPDPLALTGMGILLAAGVSVAIFGGRGEGRGKEEAESGK